MITASKKILFQGLNDHQGACSLCKINISFTSIYIKLLIIA
jgi:hypothetical protein